MHASWAPHSCTTTYRLWILERKGVVLNMPPNVKEKHSTDLQILLFVSEILNNYINLTYTAAVC
jgi:hypothetical protein